MKNLPIWIFAWLLMACASTKPTDTITLNDVQAAQKLLGLEFSEARIDTMLGYLEENLKGYEQMRTYELSYNTEPALYFEPFPIGFEFPTETPIQDWQTPSNVDLPDDPETIAFLPILELASLIKDRKLTSVQLTGIYLSRIKKHDPQLLSFITITEERALEQAKKADEEIAAGKFRGPLHGIPYGVKDLAAVPGYPTTWGSAPYKHQYIDQTATVVKKLEEAGAVLLGKLVSGGARARRRMVWWQNQKSMGPQSGGHRLFGRFRCGDCGRLGCLCHRYRNTRIDRLAFEPLRRDGIEADLWCSKSVWIYDFVLVNGQSWTNRTISPRLCGRV